MQNRPCSPTARNQMGAGPWTTTIYADRGAAPAFTRSLQGAGECAQDPGAGRAERGLFDDLRLLGSTGAPRTFCDRPVIACVFDRPLDALRFDDSHCLADAPCHGWQLWTSNATTTMMRVGLTIKESSRLVLFVNARTKPQLVVSGQGDGGISNAISSCRSKWWFSDAVDSARRQGDPPGPAADLQGVHQETVAPVGWGSCSGSGPLVPDRLCGFFDG